MVKSLSIHGLRGFGEAKKFDFAVPNKKAGSGITFIVGANNSGKTTILEALRSFNLDPSHSPTFSERKRNRKSDGGKVHLKLVNEKGEIYSIDSTERGGSPTEYKLNGKRIERYYSGLSIFTLQSRRHVDYTFHRSNASNREEYLRNQIQNTPNRSASLSNFGARLFKMYANKTEFDVLLRRILGHDLIWTIDQSEDGQYFVKFTVNGQDHSSEGLGDGIWSIFTICDALYDSQPQSMIVIDEPELSLHPTYQKRTLELIKDFAKDRQIVICTHSPYFIDLPSLIDGAVLLRTAKNKEGDIEVFHLSQEAKSSFSGFLGDLYQPHTFGTEAKEIFFVEDKIILVEGQEDVVMYSKAAEQLSFQLHGCFFGWGAGGADKIPKVLRILNDLGYQKVAVIFDGDKVAEKERYEKEYSEYQFFNISTDDIRDKDATEHRAAKTGMMEKGGVLKEAYREEMENLLKDINVYLDAPCKE